MWYYSGWGLSLGIQFIKFKTIKLTLEIVLQYLCAQFDFHENRFGWDVFIFYDYYFLFYKTEYLLFLAMEK